MDCTRPRPGAPTRCRVRDAGRHCHSLGSEQSPWRGFVRGHDPPQPRIPHAYQATRRTSLLRPNRSSRSAPSRPDRTLLLVRRLPRAVELRRDIFLVSRTLELVRVLRPPDRGRDSARPQAPDDRSLSGESALGPHRPRHRRPCPGGAALHAEGGRHRLAPRRQLSVQPAVGRLDRSALDSLARRKSSWSDVSPRPLRGRR